MRACIYKGRVIEAQSDATPGTLMANAIGLGFAKADIEEREVTEAELSALIAAQPKTADEVREERDKRLAADVDKINAVRWNAMSSAQQAAWTAYRQALCDVPEQPGFPATITWPVLPR